MKKGKRILKFSSVVFAVILILGGVWWYRQSKFLHNVNVKKSEVPTLFIPGYMGNRLSFGGMIFRLDHYGMGTSAMTIRVSAKGEITFAQKTSLKTKNPLIQVLFENNRNERLQAAQLSKVLIQLKRNYHINKVNLVGHSSGGNIVFDYLISKDAKNSWAPQVVKYVNIATTFPGREKSGKNLNPNLRVLNIAGNIWNLKTDGGIPLKEDLYLKKIVKPYVKDYRAEVINGSPLTAYHSMLHENGEVDRDVARFLFSGKD